MFRLVKTIKCLVIFTALLSIIGCSEPAPEEVAKSFVAACYDADTQRALSYVNMKGKTQEDSQKNREFLTGKFDRMLPLQKEKVDKSFGGVKSIEVIEIKYRNENRDSAVVKIKVSFNRECFGRDYKFEDTKVEKVDGKWMVRI